jgi:hypothetical protein
MGADIYQKRLQRVEILASREHGAMRVAEGMKLS